jgi:dTDP-4-dehydrorhamnose reductase
MTKIHKPKTVLVLGASGMLGHMLVRVLSKRHQVVGTTSSKYDSKSPLARVLDKINWIDQVDVRNWHTVENAIRHVKPNVLINCVGVIKQKMDSGNIMDAILINSLLPHQLATTCKKLDIRLIHFSTDCVFEGTPGIKHLSDTPNATDLYGTTKRLGEVNDGNALTIRSSIVGCQIKGSESLFQWAISQRGKKVYGRTNARYSGLTTMAMAQAVLNLIEHFPQIHGIQQIASEPISKFDLLSKLNRALNLQLIIEPSNDLIIDRALDGSQFTQLTDIQIPSWDEMLNEFSADQDFYNFN